VVQSSPAFPGKETQFGFSWGPAEVTRLCSDPKWGVIFQVKTPKGTLEIRVTPKGFIRGDHPKPKK
jgi:hypothetical protein